MSNNIKAKIHVVNVSCEMIWFNNYKTEVTIESGMHGPKRTFISSDEKMFQKVIGLGLKSGDYVEVDYHLHRIDFGNHPSISKLGRVEYRSELLDIKKVEKKEEK